jgi:colanic acid biosynthesis glycosyl transferase WcaI
LNSHSKATGDASNTKARLLFINRSYWPDAEATGQLLTDLCESLADRFEVSVLCGQPNSNPTASDFIEAGTQTRNNVTIHRLKHAHFNKRRPLSRIANLISFTLATKRWLGRSQSYDIVISETDPFLLPLVVSPHCKARGATYVAYLQDIYPDIAIRLGKARDGWLTRQIRKRLQMAYRSARWIVVLSASMKQELIDWGLYASAIAIVPNWVDCQAVVPVKTANQFRKANHWEDRFVVMHSGNMGMSQRLCSLIQSVDEPSFPSHGKVVLIGGGADEPRLRKIAAATNRHEAIEFLPYQPREALAESLSAADVQVISIDPRIGGTLMPSKLYGILASGTPVLAISAPSSDVANIVTENRLGAVVPDHHPRAIADAIAKLADQTPERRNEMQQKARLLAVSQYDRHICVQQFAELLSTALRERQSPAN